MRPPGRLKFKGFMMTIDYILVDATNVAWPGALAYRGACSRTGYPTEESARRRAKQVRDHYAAKIGGGGPDLRVRRRVGGKIIT